MNYEMSKSILELLNCIKADYYSFKTRNGTKSLDDHAAQMCDKFNEELGFNVGRKYAKITNNNGGSVWGFVVLEDDAKFKAGDILKPAGWSTPARNQSRGNILAEDFSWVQWTGPAYC